MGEKLPPSFSSRALKPRISGEVSGDRVATLGASDLWRQRVGIAAWSALIGTWNLVQEGKAMMHPCSHHPLSKPRVTSRGYAFISAGSAMVRILDISRKGTSSHHPQPTLKSTGPGGNLRAECMGRRVAGHHPLEPRRTTSFWCKGDFPVGVVFFSIKFPGQKTRRSVNFF